MGAPLSTPESLRTPTVPGDWLLPADMFLTPSGTHSTHPAPQGGWRMLGLGLGSRTTQLFVIDESVLSVSQQGDKDFPPAAAQVAHQKPHASIDKHPCPRTQHIQQPRK